MLKRLFSHYIAEEVRPMVRLAIPLVLAELGWMTMGIVDTMMVGRLSDSARAIGAVSLASILYIAVAIFGTGLTRPVSGLVESVITDLNESGISIVSIDLPSGLSADSAEPS